MNTTSLACLAALAVTLPLADARAQCTNPPAGLVGWWSGDGHGFDLAGTNKAYTTNGASFGPGVISQAFVLNGDRQYARVGNPASLQLQTLTLSSWVKRADLARISQYTPNGPGGMIFSFGLKGYGLGMMNDGNFLLSKIGVSGVFAGWSVSDTNWHHLAVTKSGSAVVFYLDGNASPPQTYDPGFEFTTDVAVGGRADSEGGSFWGSLDEIMVFNRALSANEIAGLRSASSAGFCKESKLLAPPQNATAYVGQSSAPMTVMASGNGLTYQWWRNGTSLSGQTNASLILANPQFADAGDYTVVLGDGTGWSATSTPPATLTIKWAANVPAGLVAWWPGDANGFDLAYANHAQPTNGAGFGPGLVGQAFVFGGNRQYARVGNPASLHLQTLTLSAWVKRADAAQISQYTPDGPGGILFGFGFKGYGLAMLNDGDFLLSKIGVSGVFAGQRVRDTNWHHLAATKNGSVVIFYLDGLASLPQTYDPGFEFITDAAVGARADSEGGSFWGSLDEIAVFNRALAPEEISLLIAAGSAGMCKSPTLDIFPASGGVLLSWPAGIPSLKLQASPDLSSNNWQTLTNTIRLDGARGTVLLPTTEDCRFFRLKSGN